MSDYYYSCCFKNNYCPSHDNYALILLMPMLQSQSFSNTILFLHLFLFLFYFFFTLKCHWNPHRSRRNLTKFTSLLDSYTNLFIFIDQFCHSTKKNRSHHVHNFLRTPQTDVVDKLNSIHPQLAVELLAKETVKYNLS